jgi:hypothetical protein
MLTVLMASNQGFNIPTSNSMSKEINKLHESIQVLICAGIFLVIIFLIATHLGFGTPSGAMADNMNALLLTTMIFAGVAMAAVIAISVVLVLQMQKKEGQLSENAKTIVKQAIDNANDTQKMSHDNPLSNNARRISEQERTTDDHAKILEEFDNTVKDLRQKDNEFSLHNMEIQEKFNDFENTQSLENSHFHQNLNTLENNYKQLNDKVSTSHTEMNDAINEANLSFKKEIQMQEENWTEIINSTKAKLETNIQNTTEGVRVATDQAISTAFTQLSNDFNDEVKVLKDVDAILGRDVQQNKVDLGTQSIAVSKNANAAADNKKQLEEQSIAVSKNANAAADNKKQLEEQSIAVSKNTNAAADNKKQLEEQGGAIEDNKQAANANKQKTETNAGQISDHESRITVLESNSSGGSGSAQPSTPQTSGMLPMVERNSIQEANLVCPSVEPNVPKPLAIVTAASGYDTSIRRHLESLENLLRYMLWAAATQPQNQQFETFFNYTMHKFLRTMSSRPEKPSIGSPFMPNLNNQQAQELMNYSGGDPNVRDFFNEVKRFIGSSKEFAHIGFADVPDMATPDGIPDAWMVTANNNFPTLAKMRMRLSGFIDRFHKETLSPEQKINILNELNIMRYLAECAERNMKDYFGRCRRSIEHFNNIKTLGQSTNIKNNPVVELLHNQIMEYGLTIPPLISPDYTGTSEHDYMNGRTPIILFSNNGEFQNTKTNIAGTMTSVSSGFPGFPSAMKIAATKMTMMKNMLKTVIELLIQSLAP